MRGSASKRPRHRRPTSTKDSHSAPAGSRTFRAAGTHCLRPSSRARSRPFRTRRSWCKHRTRCRRIHTRRGIQRIRRQSRASMEPFRSGVLWWGRSAFRHWGPRPSPPSHRCPRRQREHRSRSGSSVPRQDTGSRSARSYSGRSAGTAPSGMRSGRPIGRCTKPSPSGTHRRCPGKSPQSVSPHRPSLEHTACRARSHEGHENSLRSVRRLTEAEGLCQPVPGARIAGSTDPIAGDWRRPGTRPQPARSGEATH
jgi:hypothetical protein